MSERIDHVAEAISCGRRGETAATIEEAIAFTLNAQAHATLALVEQQQTANLIAYVQLLESQYAEGDRNPDAFDQATKAASVARHGVALDRIREGLGL